MPQYIIGLIIGATFMVWLLNLRMARILRKGNVTVFMCKYLFFLINNIGSSKPELDMFLMSHLRICTKADCLCDNLMDFYLNKGNPNKE